MSDSPDTADELVTDPKPDKRKPKACYLTVKERVAQVERLMCRGYQVSTITRKCSKEWNVTIRQARNYVRKVEAMWAKEATPDVVRVAQRRHQIEAVLELCIMRKKERAALTALEMLCKIDGCFAADQVEVSGTIGHGLNMLGTMGFSTPAEIRARIPELQARVLQLQAEPPQAIDAQSVERAIVVKPTNGTGKPLNGNGAASGDDSEDDEPDEGAGSVH